MKVFISWSGVRSRLVAELIEGWIKCVLQTSQPWISTKNIDKGSVWYSEIAEQLSQTSAGIVCLTPENKDNRWILFEAGALAKGLNVNRVYTFLIDLEPTEIEDPLAQFNHTRCNKEEMHSLVSSLNSRLDTPLAEVVLRKVFDTYWPSFESDYKAVIEANKPEEVVVARSSESKIDELLTGMRGLVGRVRDIERNQSVSMDTGLATFHHDSFRKPLAGNQEYIAHLKKLAVEHLAAGASLFDVQQRLLGMGVSAGMANQAITSAEQELASAQA